VEHRNEPETLPFARLTVLDLATLAAAPQIAAFFGDFGARVIKIEHPRGDSLRQLVDAGGTSLTWKIVNRNKQNVTLDIARPAGRAILERMLARADVLICNLSRARLERFELTPRRLAATQPHLVVVNLTAYGTSGPWAERPGSGTLAEAMTGLAALTGAADGPPTLSPVGLGDYMGVLQGIVAALVGLYARDAGGRERDPGARGDAFDVAMYEPLLGLLSLRLAAMARDGVEPGRHGNRFPTVAPRNTYRTVDGAWVALTAGTDDLAHRALAVIGRPELRHDPRFVDNLARVRHAEELDALLGAWIAARPCAAVVDAFNAGGVSLAAVDGLGAVLSNPHFRARGSLVDVPDGEGGTLTTAAPLPHGAHDPGRIASLGGARGADNEAVFAGWLGYTGEQLAAFRREGVL
jgi:crotonobetainyl-CoA:carnitine CoA-transferase CaiB-like acyl-CoA transferase